MCKLQSRVCRSGADCQGPWQPQGGRLEGRAVTLTLRYSFRRSHSKWECLVSTCSEGMQPVLSS